MNVDLYTKAVLTVIAGCLLWIVARDVTLVPDARAQDQSGMAIGGEVKVDIVRVGGARLNVPLPVKIVEVDQMIRGTLPVTVQK